MSYFFHATQAGGHLEKEKGPAVKNENDLTDTQKKGKTIRADFY